MVKLWGRALFLRAREDRLVDSLKANCTDVTVCSSLQDGVDVLEGGLPFQLVVVDGDDMEAGIWLAAAAKKRVPRPIVVVLHDVALSIDDAFALGRAGVDRLVRRPVSAEQLFAELEAALELPPPIIEDVVAPFLGRVSLLELEGAVRRALVGQALVVTDDNRTQAARLLRVPRMIVQRIAGVSAATKRKRRKRR